MRYLTAAFAALALLVLTGGTVVKRGPSNQLRTTSLFSGSATDISITNDSYCVFGITGTTMSSTVGHIPTRAGSIVGISSTFSISALTVSGDLTISVRVDGSDVFSAAPVTLSGTGITTVVARQIVGTDRFAAGDVISCFLNKDGTLSATIDWNESTIDIVYDQS